MSLASQVAAATGETVGRIHFLGFSEAQQALPAESKEDAHADETTNLWLQGTRSACKQDRARLRQVRQRLRRRKPRQLATA